MSHQVICEDLPSTTFLQESEFGAMHLEKQDGQTTRVSGQEVAHANLSARQAKESEGRPTFFFSVAILIISLLLAYPIHRGIWMGCRNLELPCLCSGSEQV